MTSLALLLLAAAPAASAPASAPVQLDDGAFRLARPAGRKEHDEVMAIVGLGEDAARHCEAQGLGGPKVGALSILPIPKGDPRRPKGGNEYSITYRCEPPAGPATAK